MYNRVSSTNRRGFTLIELLVVIAIIALLAAILFPVFARARENARKSSCLNNLKQIGIGLLQYSQDFDETLPRAHYNGNVDSDLTHWKWMDCIYPYVKSNQSFVCPSDTSARRFYNYHKNLTGTSNAYGSYNINSAYYNGGDAHKSPAGEYVSMPDVASPATTVWAADGRDNFEFAWDTTAPAISTGSPRMMHSIVERHLETVGAVYVDGHVKASRLESLAEKNSSGIARFFTIAND